MDTAIWTAHSSFRRFGRNVRKDGMEQKAKVVIRHTLATVVTLTTSHLGPFMAAATPEAEQRKPSRGVLAQAMGDGGTWHPTKRTVPDCERRRTVVVRVNVGRVLLVVRLGLGDRHGLGLQRGLFPVVFFFLNRRERQSKALVAKVVMTAVVTHGGELWPQPRQEDP